MKGTTFRTQTIPAEVPKETAKTKEPTDKKAPLHEASVEPSYLDYEVIKGKPYLVKHFELGDTWNEPVGGFTKELAVIGEYIESEIKTGKIGNDISSVKEVIKKAEKMTNQTKETRLVMKLGILSEYMKFLMKVDKIKYNAQRYANT